MKQLPTTKKSINRILIAPVCSFSQYRITHVRGGSWGGGLAVGQNPKYPCQTRCLGKMLTKNVFLRSF